VETVNAYQEVGMTARLGRSQPAQAVGKARPEIRLYRLCWGVPRVSPTPAGSLDLEAREEFVDCRSQVGSDPEILVFFER
jgi:hypothetical protein